MVFSFVLAACSDDPTFAPIDVCGDGERTGGEQCDDGNTLGGDGCSDGCRLESCGNGRLDAHELCDDGNTADGDGCRADCLGNETCGDRMVDLGAGELCDDGDTVDGDGCEANCTLSCGNGVIDPVEQCDDSGHADGDGCSAICSIERCGDGDLDQSGATAAYLEMVADCATVTLTIDDTLVQTIEVECACQTAQRYPLDAAAVAALTDGEHDIDLEVTITKGNGLGWAVLTVETSYPVGPIPADRASFVVASPGDIDNPYSCNQYLYTGAFSSTIAIGEVCDDGNRTGGDGCRADCQGTEECQDGLLDVGEQCDDGNNVAGDGCTAACVTEFCGDGTTNNNGEACDDGNMLGGDGCESNCLLTCGNSVRDQARRFRGLGAIGATLTGTALASGDVNGDGRADVVAVGSGAVHAFLLDGAGGITTVTSAVDAAALTAQLVDLDGDTVRDLVASSTGASGVRWAKGDGAGHFAAFVAIGAESTRAAIGDFNGDARPDIVANATGDALSVFYGDGAGGFQSPSLLSPIGTNMTAAVAADLNGDGRTELMMITPTRFYTYVNSGGSLSVDDVVTLANAPIDIVGGDVDGDGDIDAVIRSSTGIDVRFGGSERFAPHHIALQPNAVLAAQLDADTAVEIAVGATDGIWVTESNLADVMPPLGAGMRPNPYGQLRALAVASIDADARPDLFFIDSGGVVHRALAYDGSFEECDDGDSTDGNGCSTTCALPACARDLGAYRGIDDGAGTCFVAFERATWSNALAACEVVGDTLAVLDDAATTALVTPLARNGSMWFGYGDAEVEGTWRWVNGSTSTYTHWQFSEPNNSGDEDCAQLYASGFWNDARCGDALPYVCEVPYGVAAPN